MDAKQAARSKRLTKPRNRRRILSAGVLFLVVGACAWQDGQWRPIEAAPPQTAAGHSSQPSAVEQHPASEAAAEAVATPATVAVEDDARLAAARDQVLEFIRQLEQAGGSVDSAAVETDPAGDGDADSSVERGRSLTSEQQARPVVSPAYSQQRQRQAEIAIDSSGPATANSVPPSTASPIHGSGSPPRVLGIMVDRPSAPPPASLPALEGEDEAAERFANRPMGGVPMGIIDQQVNQLETRIREFPGDADARWRLTLVNAGLGRESPAVASLTGEAPSADMWGQARSAVSALGQALADPVSGSGVALSAVNALRGSLVSQADLEIPVVRFCSRVQAYGVYDVLPESTFRENTTNDAIVYFELKRFSSERTADDRFRTVIRETFEVLTPQGEVKWSHDEPSIEDHCKTRREDFFVAQRITLPATLPAGRYVFKVTVEDQLAQKRTQATHEFQIESVSVSTTSHRR